MLNYVYLFIILDITHLFRKVSHNDGLHSINYLQSMKELKNNFLSYTHNNTTMDRSTSTENLGHHFFFLLYPLH
jgi:hypothetical protein